MLKQLPLHFVEYQFQQPLTWNCYKFLKCSLLKWEYSVSKAHIHAAAKGKKQWSSNFLYMNFTKNLALWNSPQISLQLRFVFNWKDLQNHPNILRQPLGLFILSLHGIFMQNYIMEIQYCKLLRILQIKWLSFLQNMNIHPCLHTQHMALQRTQKSACSRNCQRKQFTGTEIAETTWTGSVHATTRLHCTTKILTKCPQKCQEATSKF